MPPERFPWDRKDLRKYVRPTPRWRESSSSHYGSKYDKSTPRWRESPSNHYGPSRWGGSNEFRRPPGHGKQGGWQMFAEESGHGYTPFRSSDRMLDDKNFRPTVARVDGKYGRNSRDRASFGARDWRAHSWDMSNGSPNTPGRLHDLSNDQRSVDDILTYPTSHAQPEFPSSWNEVRPKEQHDNNKLDGVNWLEEGQRCDRETSLDWKPLKWARSISLSSRGSGFSNSSCSKSLGGADSNEGKAELHVKNVPVVTSPSGEAAACVTSALSEEMSARKKPRLNWGEGLAKYEKKRVEGPEEHVDKDGVVISCRDHEAIHSECLNLVDSSPRAVGISECGSPATPSSVACSSQGPEEKSFGKAIIVDNDAINLCGSPSTGSQSHTECFPFNLEVLDGTSITNLLVELLQYDDSSVDSSFVRSTVMNKLLILKDSISKTLEVTEFEIDSLENELKSLKCESGSRCPCPAVSGSLLVEDNAKLCSEQVVASNNTPRPSPLQVLSCADENVGEVPVCNNLLDEVNCCIKDDDVDSPGTATSKYFEPVSIAKVICSPCGPMKLDEYSGDTNVEGSAVSSRGNVNMLKENKGASVSSILTLAEDNLCNMIFVSNKESASRASNIFYRLLPRDQCKVDFSEISDIALQKDDVMVRENFALRRRFMKFRERVVAIKFKAFHHLWKEDMRLLSIRKYRAKSQKKNESTLRTTQCVIQKNRSSLRLWFSSPVGNLSLVPTTEMLNFTRKLLSESEVKLYRNDLKMPSLVLDKSERSSQFISQNGLIEDPWAVEKERAMINPWTSEEREIFIDKLATFGKDFQKIALFLDHKTTADCVEFYYKNHKSDCFERTKKSKQGKPCTNYLVASGNNRKREMNAASVDGIEKQQVHDDNGKLDKPSNYDMLEDERETVAADILAGISGAISSESQKVNNSGISDVSQTLDDETCSDDSCGEMMDAADWTDEEKCVFVQAVSCYGKNFDMISECVGTRSRDQCKVFFSKARKCLGLDSVHRGLGNTEDGFALETTCSDKLGLLETVPASVTQKTSDSCLTENNKVNSPFDCGSKVNQSESVQAQENSNESVSSEARREKSTEDGNSAGQAINLDANTVLQGHGVCFEGKKSLFPESSWKSQIDASKVLPCVSPCRENGKDDHLQLLQAQSPILRGYPLQIPAKNECLVPEQSNKQVSSSGDVKLFGKILSKPNPNPNPVNSVLKFDQMTLENVPVKRSYGLWDGNKIHTSVPDYFLSKYPEAFRSSSSTSGSNGLVDYQMYRPYSVQRNGFEPMVGVSDPVAALKMQYTQNGEHEAWSSRGHFGR